jgi:hypothetical protein
MNSDPYKQFKELQAKTQQHRRAIKPILIDFASSVWGRSKAWSWSEQPKGCFIQYPWIGVIAHKEPCRSSDPLDADSRYGVILETDYSFRVLAFQEHVYQYLQRQWGTSVIALYLCRTEVSLNAPETGSGVRESLDQLYHYLKQNPVFLISESYKHAPVEIDQEVGPGIRLTQKVVNRWRPPW